MERSREGEVGLHPTGSQPGAQKPRGASGALLRMKTASSQAHERLRFFTYRGQPAVRPRPRGRKISLRLSMPRRYFIKTFGCPMNEYDSARMAEVTHARPGPLPT